MVYINEVFSNPTGKDTGNEWLEFFNSASTGANIEGWHLTVNGKSVVLHGGIPAERYRVLRSTDLHRTLTNREATLGLYDSVGRLENSLIVHGTAWEGKSYARLGGGVFHWTVPTPGTENAMPTSSIFAQQTQPVGINLVSHPSFTHALGSGMLIAIAFAASICYVFHKNDALPQFLSRGYTRLCG